MKRNKNFKNQGFRFCTWRFNVQKIGDILRWKTGTYFCRLLIKMKILVGGSISNSLVIRLKSVIARLRKIRNTRGIKGLTLYLKACSVSFQQSISGYRHDNCMDLGARVSRSRISGIPRIIPAEHRLIIRCNRPGKYLWIKFYLTLFGVYRVLEFPGVLKLSTILDSGCNFNIGMLEGYMERFLKLAVRPSAWEGFSMERWTSRFGFFHILRSSPQTSLIRRGPRSDKWTLKGLWSTHPVSLLESVAAVKGHSLRWVFEEFAEAFAPRLSLLFSETFTEPWDIRIGSLGFKEEPAGKVRVFAMVDPLTQWLLRPLHRGLFAILRQLPMDGTFDQLRPIHRLLKRSKKAVGRSKGFYSFDLSAATDRIPVTIQARLLDLLVKQIPNFGSKWRALLTNRSYEYHHPRHGSGSVRYGVGQPMGALSSWSMMAFTHHFLVQVSAWEAGWAKSKLFKAYAILGDDIVLTVRRIADSYRALMSSIGVGIGLAKSILSPSGVGLEFAKSTFIDGVDVSPISWLDVHESMKDLSTWAAFARDWGVSLERQARFLGHGYRARRKSFRRSNHALQLLYLVSFTRKTFGLNVFLLQKGRPTTYDQEYLDLFKESVLDPLKTTLMGDRAAWKGVNPLYVFQQLDFVREREDPEYWEDLLTCWQILYWDNIDRIASRIFRAAIPLFSPWKIKTFSEAMDLYLRVFKEKATMSVDVAYLRDGRLRGSSSHPYQVRLFRAWARVSHKVLTDFRKTKSETTSQTA